MAAVWPCPLPPDWTATNRLAQLGDIPPSRVRLVWNNDAAARTAKAYTAPNPVVVYSDPDPLPGGEALSGLQSSLAKLFAEIQAGQTETSP